MIKSRARSSGLGAINGINITPFTDVCLVLLIIFLVTMPKIAADSIVLNLPQADPTPTVDKTPPILIHVVADGVNNYVFMVSDHDIQNFRVPSYNELYVELKKDFTTDPKQSLVLKADKAVPYQTMIDTIDTVRKSGFVDFGLAAAKTPVPGETSSSP